jgi:hypothetical protein
LQCRASCVGERLARGITISSEIKDQPANRIRGVTALVEHGLPIFVAMNGLVMAKGN